MGIGSKITALRKARNITQKQLAAYLNVTDKAVSRWESGAGCPEIGLIPKIASFFGVSTDYLLSDGDEKEKQKPKKAPKKKRSIGSFFNRLVTSKVVSSKPFFLGSIALLGQVAVCLAVFVVLFCMVQTNPSFLYSSRLRKFAGSYSSTTVSVSDPSTTAIVEIRPDFTTFGGPSMDNYYVSAVLGCGSEEGYVFTFFHESTDKGSWDYLFYWFSCGVGNLSNYSSMTYTAWGGVNRSCPRCAYGSDATTFDISLSTKSGAVIDYRSSDYEEWRAIVKKYCDISDKAYSKVLSDKGIDANIYDIFKDDEEGLERSHNSSTAFKVLAITFGCCTGVLAVPAALAIVSKSKANGKGDPKKDG